MPGTDSYYPRSSRGGDPAAHGRSSSLTNLARLPAEARKRLQSLAQRAPFVRFMGDNDAQDRDENDIYRLRNPADQVFTFERWNKHRNPLRYAKHLLHMFTSRVFRQLLGPVLAVMALALAVGIYESLVTAGGLPGHWPHVTLALGQGFNLTAFALSLLLVFRTNSSYDRWWEARKLWGGVVNRTRDFVRQSLVFFGEGDGRLQELLARWTMAFPRVLMCHLREDSDVAKEVAHILTAHEVAVMCAAAHRPNFVLQVMAEAVRVARPPELCRMRMDENLTFFEDAMGSCERILRTPIPLSYTCHTSRFLLVWLILLPFTLWAAYSWFSVLLSGIFAFLMFGIDEIGVQIEEPFGILPLEAIGATIERNIRELLLRNHEVEDVVLAASGAAGASDAAEGAAGAGLDLAGGGNTEALAEEEFGEMTGAAAGTAWSSYAAPKQALAAGRLISLVATSAAEAGGSGSPAAPAAAHAQPRRVQFGEATVIEMEGSRAQEGAALPGSPARFADLSGAAGSAQQPLHRRASLAEVELASGASPDVSPRDGAGGRGGYLSSWLND